MWRKGNPSALLVGMQTGEATVENSMESPQKIQKGALALNPGMCPDQESNQQPFASPAHTQSTELY